MASKGKPVISEDLYEFPYSKPTRTSRIVAFRNCIYNPELGAVFGRTPTNWAALIFFYTIFFSVLAAMFAVCMYGLLASLSKERPTYVLGASIIGTNPGLGYRPLPTNVESGSVIWYIASDEQSVKSWTSNIDEFLKDYSKNKNSTLGKNSAICSFDHLPDNGKVCDVDIDDFGPCSSENGYSYGKSSPCIFIKLNRIFDWVPEYYNNTADLPEEMDDDLKSVIASTPVAERNVIWVTCYGENVADREHIGPVSYYPKRGFPGYFYPFRNTPGYLSPLVAVFFERPTPGLLINIECRAWAKNIEFKRHLANREGSVHFEILID